MIKKFSSKKQSYQIPLTTPSTTFLPFSVEQDYPGRTEIGLNKYLQYLKKLSEEMLWQTILSLSLINPVVVEYHRFVCCVEAKG